MNLNPEVQKPRISRMTRMGYHFVSGWNYWPLHLPGERPFCQNIFFIRAIREIRGSNCFF